MSLAQIQEAPEKGLILLAGAPGAGKSTFCHQVVLNSLAAYRPVIFVTTERSASEVVSLLREKGLGEPIPGALRFVDAFSETVGLTPKQRSDTVHANCADLNSLSITITKLQLHALGPPKVPNDDIQLEQADGIRCKRVYQVSSLAYEASPQIHAEGLVQGQGYEKNDVIPRAHIGRRSHRHRGIP